MGCQFCDKKNSGLFIWEFKNWVVEHAKESSIDGWLLLVLKRHSEALHDLTPTEWEDFKNATKLVCEALLNIKKCKKQYVILLSEGIETHHTHFHIIPRAHNIPDENKGRNIFDAFGPQVSNRISPEQISKNLGLFQNYFKEHINDNRNSR